MKKKTRILVVDDDLNMAKTLVNILRTKGYRTEGAHTGDEALAFAKENNFDCVLSDIKMPGMNGVELFQAFQEHHPNIPIILMTAYAPNDLLTAGAVKGVVAILNKPIDFDLLFMYLSALDNPNGF